MRINEVIMEHIDCKSTDVYLLASGRETREERSTEKI